MYSDYLKAAREVIANPNPAGNATIRFSQATTMVIEFDELGNASEVVGTEDVVLVAWMQQARPPDREVQSGPNQNRLYYEGEMTEPKTFEIPLRPEGDILIEINGRSGKFYPVELFDSPASLQYSIRIFLGQKIAGWVEIEEGS